MNRAVGVAFGVGAIFLLIANQAGSECKDVASCIKECDADTCRSGVYTFTKTIVHDTENDLLWQRSHSNRSFDWKGAKLYCQHLHWGGYSSGWRLPTLDELSSIGGTYRREDDQKSLAEIQALGLTTYDRTLFPFTPAHSKECRAVHYTTPGQAQDYSCGHFWSATLDDQMGSPTNQHAWILSVGSDRFKHQIRDWSARMSASIDSPAWARCVRR